MHLKCRYCGITLHRMKVPGEAPGEVTWFHNLEEVVSTLTTILSKCKRGMAFTPGGEGDPIKDSIKYEPFTAKKWPTEHAPKMMGLA